VPESSFKLNETTPANLPTVLYLFIIDKWKKELRKATDRALCRAGIHEWLVF